MDLTLNELNEDELNELNEDEFDTLMREIWPLLRRHKIKPMEILPFVHGFTEYDKDDISSAAKNRTNTECIDSLYEAIRRRNRDCFISFLDALRENEYDNLWMAIMTTGKTILSNRKPPSLITKENLTQANNTQKLDQQNRKSTKTFPYTKGYKKCNIADSPVASDARFEIVTLGLPRLTGSLSNLKENIQNNVMDSPSQSSRNLSESRQSNRSSFAKTPMSEKFLDSCDPAMKCIAETGHTISYGSREKSAQAEDQQLQMIPTLTSRSTRGAKGSDISPIIRDTQKEIALANKKKELDSSCSEAYGIEASEQPSSLGVECDHQTSPKSYHPDDNVNILNYFSDVNMKAITQSTSNKEFIRPREIVLYKEQNNREGQKGSSLVQGIRDIRKNIEPFGFENKSNVARPSGSSISNPVQFASAPTKVGNPIATSEASANQSSQSDLSQYGQQSSENDIVSQQIQETYRYPVPVSDDSDAKNLEMEASALREDMANQSNTIGYRDIQNSIPDQNHRSFENREYHSSKVDQFCYSDGGRLRLQGRYNSSNAPTNMRETSDRREGSIFGSMSNALNDCPPLDNNLLNEETPTSNNNS